MTVAVSTYPFQFPVPKGGLDLFKLIFAVIGLHNFKFRPAYIPEANTKHALRDGAVLTVSAVIPVTMVLLRKTCNDPEVRQWTVPFYGPMLNPSETGQAYLAIEITRLINDLEDGVHASYLLLDGEVYGATCKILGG